MSLWLGLDASQLSTEDACGTNPPFRAARAAMASALPASSNGGVLWWERDEHGAYNSLFDAHYVARPALLQGFRDADATRAHEGASAVHERVNESV